MASSQAMPEPMNAQSHHPKVKITITLPDPTFVAGTHVSGKMEMECRADRGLGIGIMMVELFAIQELSSRDHSATSTFLHSRRLFQGEGLPPSNAVQAHPMPGDPLLPPHYYQARRGRSTFLFRIPIPASSPSAISFGSGLAKVRYELRASVGVYWKNEKRLVIDKHAIDIVESYPYNDLALGKIPEGIVVGENGKIWMQGRIIGNVIEAGGIACLELQVKNHSNKKNSGLTLSLTRTLHLAESATGQQQPAPVQISDTLTTVPFRGAEYIIPPGAEGIANLVFDVPKDARSVRGGILDGEEGGDGPRRTEALFEIRAKVEVRLIMGLGSKDIVLQVPVEITHPLAMPPVDQVPAPYAQPYFAPEPPISQLPVNQLPYNAYYAAPPMSPAPAVIPVPMHIPYVDPTQNQVWLPPPPSIPASHTPVGYPYPLPSTTPLEPYQALTQPYSQPYYAPQSPLHSQPGLVPPVGPVSSATYIPRPSSAGPVVMASQVPQPMVQGLPPPSSTHLHPHNDVNYTQMAVAGPLEPEVGKGERASRIAQQLRMSSRNRSVSPQSHRYPVPASLLPVNESYVPDTSSMAATVGASSAPTSRPIQIRQLPQPPVMSRSENLSLSPPTAEAVLHSPRPQLTPKHSFTRDPVLGTTSKSERVEELEKMADEVARKSQDLSGDLPKESSKPSANETSAKASENGVNVNKTLPGPPVPSGKLLSPLPSRTRADQLFANQEVAVLETAPLPSDQTPPTPALLAVLPSRRTDRNELKTENGLDALERRLLAEVGTRKFDIKKDQKPVLKSILPIETDTISHKTSAIPIPVKSPEPLHDSAISSLTLAGGLAGDESDGEFDGHTHRAGSQGGSGNEKEGMYGLHRHMREKAEASTPTKIMDREREREARERGRRYDSSDDLEKTKSKEKSKEGRTSGKKKDRSSTKSAAKGRVAAWLGRIDPEVPPQEQIIPPSPSVIQNLPSPFDRAHDDRFEGPSSSAGFTGPLPSVEQPPEPQNDVSATPNPRSSGFVPIATLKRETIQPRPLIARDATVVEEALRVQNIWSASEKTPVISAQSMPQFLRDHPPAPAPVSIRTDRQFSPPSTKPPPPDPKTKPMSYSAAARNAWKQDPSKVTAVSQSSPSSPPNKTPPRKVQQSGRIQSVFPSSKLGDPEVRYDIRSARGGRGGKVTSVANLWASGAISNRDLKEKEVPRRLNTVIESPTPTPSQQLRPERKLFSAAVMTPAPTKQAPVASGGGAHVLKPATGNGVNGLKSTEAQKRPDLHGGLSVSKPDPKPVPRKIPSATNLAKGSQSTDAPIQKRPATAMSTPYSLHGKVTPNSLSTPTSSEPNKLHNVVVKGVKPVIKGTSNPVAAVLSSSHAVPTLSSTASLARPAAQNITAQKDPRPVKLPTVLSTPSLSAGLPPEPPRPVSPSKPTDLAFGQARLRDLIKKYQGQGQKT